jgi:hypothetical protein
MLAGLLPAAVFISQRPARAVLAEPEQGFPSAKFAPGLIKEGIHLMGAGGNQAESILLEASGESFNIIDSELDLNFAISSHAASIKKGGEQATAAPKKLSWHPKRQFFIIPAKKEIYLFNAL